MKRKILKFGGKSLKSESGLKKCQEIILDHAEKSQLIIVISARGNTTNLLLKIINKIDNYEDYSSSWSEFLNEQDYFNYKKYIQKDILRLNKKLNSLKEEGINSDSERKEVLAFGEKISVKILKASLEKVDKCFIDADSTYLFKTERKKNIHSLNDDLSRNLMIKFYDKCPKNSHLIITGFLSSDVSTNQVTNLGRNGSNYTATLLADYLNADIVINYTHVDGIYSVDPELFKDSRLISNLNYNDAIKLASLGLSIIHPHTVLPLVKKNIPLIIRSTLNPNEPGTIISNKKSKSAKIICIENLNNKIKIPQDNQSSSVDCKNSDLAKSENISRNKYIINLSGQSKKKYEKIKNHLSMNKLVNKEDINFVGNIVICRVKQENFPIVITFLHSFTI